MKTPAVEIIPYSKKHLGAWENLIASSNNGTLYHTQKFMGYHPDGRFQNFHHLMAFDGEIVCVIPGALTSSDAGKTFASYPGTSFGGFIVPEGLGLEEMDVLITRFLGFLKAEEFKRVEITLPPVFFCRRQNQHADFILSREGFGFRKREITSVVTLRYEGKTILDTFSASCGRSIRKAQKAGVEIRNDDSKEAYKDFYAILERNLSLRHNVKPTHSLAEMIDIKHRFPEGVFLYAAYFRDEMIAGIWLVKANRDVCVAFYISHAHEHQELRPVNLLYYETILKSVEWGQKYLDLGLFTVNMQPNYGLGRFKESFGAQGMFRDYFRKDL